MADYHFETAGGNENLPSRYEEKDLGFYFSINKLYKSLGRPHLEYGQEIWSPYLVKQSKLIENVQRRATNLILNIKHLKYEERLCYLNLPNLKYRRLRGDMILTLDICVIVWEKLLHVAQKIN